MLKPGVPLRRRALGASLLLVALAAIVLGTLRPNPFHHPLVVHARFDEAEGLAKVERQVRVAGVDVGEVGKVVRTGDDADLELKLDHDVPAVYADATAALRPHSAFEGSAFVDLQPGHASAGPLRGAIPVTRTRVYVPLDQALRGLDAPRRAALKDLAGQVRTASTAATERATGDLLSTLPRLARDGGDVARDLRGPTGTELRAAVTSFARVATTVDARPGRIARAVASTRRTLAAFDDGGGATLDRALSAVPPALSALHTRSGAIVALSGRLRGAARDAIPVARSAAPLLHDARPVLTQAAPVLRNGAPLLRDVRLVLGDLAGSEPALSQVLDTTGTAVDDLDTRALPLLTAKSRLGRPAYEQFLSAGAGLSGALSGYQVKGQSVSGPGHYVRISGDVVDGLLGSVFGPLCRQVPACGLVQGASG